MDLHALLIEPFTHRFMARALLVAILLGVSGALVGCVLILRRLALVADSFGHALLPGVAIAYLIAGPSLLALCLGGLVAGLVTALAAGVLSRVTRLKEDAAFGAMFVGLFALGAAILSRVAAPADLGHYLFGNILGVAAADARLAAAAAGITVLALAIGWRSVVLECFDRGFHRAAGGASATVHAAILMLTVLNLVAALHSVGLVLALGLFVLPAVTAQLWCERIGRLLLTAGLIGPLGAGLGLLLSYHLDLPSGASMVLVLGAGFALSALIAPHGVLRRWRRRRGHQVEGGDDACTVAPAAASASVPR